MMCAGAFKTPPERVSCAGGDGAGREEGEFGMVLSTMSMMLPWLGLGLLIGLVCGVLIRLFRKR